MSNIFNIMRGLEVTAEDVTKAEIFAQQFLEDKFPDIDFRQGTGVRDLVIRPNATLIALIDKALTVYFQEVSLNNIHNGSSEEVVDNLMSNFFVSRHKGDNSIIRTRMYFRFPGERAQVVQIPKSAFFSTNNEHKFYPQDNITLHPPSGTSIPGRQYLKLDTASSLWYADIDLESEAPEEVYNVTSGDLLYFTVFSPYFIKGEIQYLSKESVPKESNLEMVNRGYSAVSTRNLINTPSIVSRLTDVFNYIKFVHSEGMGDPNMYRDTVQVNNVSAGEGQVNFHVGGMVDAYVSTKPRTVVKQWVTDDNGDIYIKGSVFHCERSAVSGSPEGDDDLIPVSQPFTTEYMGQTAYTGGIPDEPSKDIGLSADQVIKISFGDSFPLRTASFVTKEFSNILDVQSFLDDKQDRVVAANYLTRSYEPHALDISIQLHDATKVTEEEMHAKVREYVDGIPNGGTFYISDIYGLLEKLGVYGVVSPMSVAVTHTDKGLNKTQYTITDSKTVPITHRFIINSFTVTVQEGS